MWKSFLRILTDVLFKLKPNSLKCILYFKVIRWWDRQKDDVKVKVKELVKNN